MQVKLKIIDAIEVGVLPPTKINFNSFIRNENIIIKHFNASVVFYIEVLKYEGAAIW